MVAAVILPSVLMNPISADTTAPPPPAQPPRSSFSCDRHPTEQFTGFCPSCLCERLTTLDQSSSNTPSSSRRPSSASAAAATAIKSLFSKPNNPAPPPPAPKPSRPPSLLRRSKSFTASKNEALALGLSLEPQRKSCDVRGRSTLSSLFTVDGGSKIAAANCTHKPKSIPAASTSLHNPPTSKKPENLDDSSSCDDDEDEIKPVVEIEATSGEIVAEEEEAASVDNVSKPTKEKTGFWAAASVFSKKFHEWRRKQKLKKPTTGDDRFSALPLEKPISRQFRETQSEIADYGFGRRSCDTDPRFSLDAGRISFDDPRYSFDDPDNYLIGRRSFSRMAAPPMVSVMEDTPNRPETQIPAVESLSNSGEGENGVLPGGSIQTRDYYLDSSSRRRKSVDRSSSARTSFAGEIDELKSLASNARVSPTTADGFHGAKVMSGENKNNGYRVNSRGSNSNSFREDVSSNYLIGNGDTKEMKKSRRWSWRIWGFIHRRNGSNTVKYGGGRENGVERSLSESWENGDSRVPRNMFRSNSSVSWRNSSTSNVGHGMRRKEEFVLERNRSVRCSPNNVENGLLRFYLAPMSNSRRGGLTKVKPNNSQTVGRSVLRLY